MNRFTADYSSSPPSTPNSQPQTRRSPMTNMSNDPSTTPAGPPPSSAASFTPMGNPPSSALGSSAYDPDLSNLRYPSRQSSGQSQDTRPTQLASTALPPRTKNGTPMVMRTTNYVKEARKFGHSKLSFTQSQSEIGCDDTYAERMQRGSEMEQDFGPGSPGFKGFTSLNAGLTPFRPQPPSFKNGPAATMPEKRVTENRLRIPRTTQLPRKGDEDLIPGIARDMASRSPIARLRESDDVISETEAIMKDLHQDLEQAKTEASIQRTLSAAALALIKLWTTHVGPSDSKSSDTVIGPSHSASAFEKANYLTSLLLALHHPPIYQDERAAYDHSSQHRAVVRSGDLYTLPIPQLLLDWLENYHVSYSRLYATVQLTSPNCTANNMFWDAVQSLLLRGKIEEVMTLFDAADFKYAITALDDGADDAGYHGVQLQTVQGLIRRARQVLAGCPGLRNGDWHVDSADWDLYRKRVTAELEHLTALADRADEGEEDDVFHTENFGVRRTGGGLLGQSSQRAARTVPWAIFQNLKILYGILLGGTEEIIAQSQDWLEAAASLVIWWDGSEDDSIIAWSTNVGRAELAHNGPAPSSRYLRRLRAAFLCVTDPGDKSSFLVNTLSPVEVGLGAILQGDVEGTLGILKMHSLCLAAATAEFASLAGWLSSTPRPAGTDLDLDDLMVLSYAGPPVGNKRDDLLLAYVEALFGHGELSSSKGDSFEGWELALTIATRFDDAELAQNTITQLIDSLPQHSQDRTDKLVALCTDLGLEEEARKVSEKYADHLVDNSAEYGTALLCYARSHSSQKLRQLVDLLVSYCLVQSKAYPTEEEMDHNLRVLVASPKGALSGLSNVDPVAAELLQFYLVGYACVRRFYTLRDEDINAERASRKPSTRPSARKRPASKALLAAISSAADGIYGGLYDPERQSAIQVDGLLTLLGEATAFIATDEENRILTTEQMYAILAAIEDLQTVSTRVYDATEECLQAALHNYQGSQPPSPHAMLKKSVSSGTNPNFSFSMMGSEMLAQSKDSLGQKSDGSAVVVGRTRKKDKMEMGWDWRAGFSEKGAKGVDILRYLRASMAQELSLAELDS